MRIQEGYILTDSVQSVLLGLDDQVIAKGPAQVWPCAGGGTFYPDTASQSNEDIARNGRILKVIDGQVFYLESLKLCEQKEREHFHFDIVPC